MSIMISFLLLIFLIVTYLMWRDRKTLIEDDPWTLVPLVETHLDSKLTLVFVGTLDKRFETLMGLSRRGELHLDHPIWIRVTPGMGNEIIVWDIKNAELMLQ